MQALDSTLFPCYAPADRAAVSAVAAFLERGANVRVFLDDGELRPGEDLVQKARDGRMADTVLVFFSRASMPSRWARAQWEDALIIEPAAEGVRIGFARCDDCAPPAVLKPRFELAGLPVKSLRELKRWIRPLITEGVVLPRPARDGNVEVLGIGLADRAGCETVPSLSLASEFVVTFRRDFDAVFALECGDRSLTALAGDLSTQMGLRLEGDLEQNLDRLRQFCSAHRFLVLLTDTGDQAPPELIFDGRCSTLIVKEGGMEAPQDPLRRIQQTFAAPNPAGAWADLCELAREGRRLAHQNVRIAECYELMELWHRAAEIREDRKVLDESAREMVWILDGWGREQEARRLEYHRALHFDDQLPLPF